MAGGPRRPVVAVVGVGLIGGSIGMAARERLGATVRGFDPGDGVLARAVSLGAVSQECGSAEEAVDGADVAFVAAPVGALPDAVRGALVAAGEDCVVTDVGSTKRSVVAAVDDPRFIGGHPLAGAETAGVEHARADLFDGATWYLTPTARTGARRRYARLAAGDRLAPAARAGQRARRAGRARALRRGRAPSCHRPLLPRRDAGGRREYADLA
jgi:prephenate dehydrogenase